MKKLKSNKKIWICMCVVIGLWCVSFVMNTLVFNMVEFLGESETNAVSTVSDLTKDSVKDTSLAADTQPRVNVIKVGSGDAVTLEGKGTEDEPYKILSYVDLKELASRVNKGELAACAELTTDIICTDTEWDPIGKDDSHIYSGIFDGKNHTITGLATPDNYSGDYAGLFGFVELRGTVKNVVLVDGHINGTGCVGAVAGWNAGKVENCYNKGHVDGFSCVGGVVGYNDSGTVTRCYNKGDIAVNGTEVIAVGGVVGYNSAYNETAQVTNCYNTGAVNVIGNMYEVDVGAVVGYNEGKVENCYNTGNVTVTEGANVCVGGVVGYNVAYYKTAQVTNCYNTGDVSGTVTATQAVYAGGVVGYNDVNSGPQATRYNTRAETGNDVIVDVVLERNTEDTAKVTNCYNTGDVTGNGEVGGVVGRNDKGIVENCYNIGVISGSENIAGVVALTNGTVTNCYYDKNVCGDIGAVKESADDDEHNVKGLTTAQMTGSKALDNMVFEYANLEDSPWLTKADGKDGDKYYWYYPHLKNFNFKDSSGTQVEWPLGFADDIEQMNADEIKAEAWPPKIEVSVIGEGLGPYTYDGFSHSYTVNKILVIVGDRELEAGKSSVLYDGNTVSPINAGEYKVEIQFENYVDKIIEIGTLTINPITDKVTVTITENSDEVMYDGQPHTISGYKNIVSDNDLYNVTTSVTETKTEAWTITETDVGIYDMGIVAADFENTNKNFTNVEFVIVDGQLKILPITDKDDQSSTTTHSSGTSSDSKVYKTSDAMAVEGLLGLEVFMILALIGLYFALKWKKT